jgi:hypothetical protein
MVDDQGRLACFRGRVLPSAPVSRSNFGTSEVASRLVRIEATVLSSTPQRPRNAVVGPCRSFLDLVGDKLPDLIAGQVPPQRIQLAWADVRFDADSVAKVEN